jgi:hypothetical protein
MVAGLAAAGAADAVFKMESAESERLNTRAVCHLVSSSRHGGRARRGAVGDRCVWSLRRKARNRDPQWAMRAAVMLAECAKKKHEKSATVYGNVCDGRGIYLRLYIYTTEYARRARHTRYR